jgi:hypothetical protein
MKKNYSNSQVTKEYYNSSVMDDTRESLIVKSNSSSTKNMNSKVINFPLVRSRTILIDPLKKE